MEKLNFKSNWQYTPFLEGTELKDGDIVHIRLADSNSFFLDVIVEVEEEFTDVHGVKIPRKMPFALLPEGKRMQLTSKNVEICRMR